MVEQPLSLLGQATRTFSSIMLVSGSSLGVEIRGADDELARKSDVLGLRGVPPKRLAPHLGHYFL
jgi:hypothetical protein